VKRRTLLASAAVAAAVTTTAGMPAFAANDLTVEVNATGTVELTWPEMDGATHYVVHRSSEPDFDPSDATVLYRLPSTRFGDHGAEPGGTWHYRVVADTGETTSVGTAVVPAEPDDNQRIALLAAIAIPRQVRLNWRIPRSARGPFVVRADGRPLHRTDQVRGAVTVRNPVVRTQHLTLTDADGAVLASATAVPPEHPRLLLDRPTIGKVRRQIADREGTAAALWEEARRLALSAGATGPEAAFVHAVTGEQRFADIAFERARSDVALVRTQSMPIEVGHTTTSLAFAYDWAHNAWTEEQRAEIRDGLKVSAAYYGTYHASNLDSPDDLASNWVACSRGPELIGHLAARGDGDYGFWDERLGTLTSNLHQNIRQALSDSGWCQEGWDYEAMITHALTLATGSAASAGVDALQDEWSRPGLANFYLHTMSLRHDQGRLQFGVGEKAGQLYGLSGLTAQTPPELLAYLVHFWQRATGPDSFHPNLEVPWTLVSWPQNDRAKEPERGPRVLTGAILDDEAGWYGFRNRHHNSDDVLVGLSNRNHHGNGWSSPEAFGLSWIGQGVTWAVMPAKDTDKAELYSKPLVDGGPGGVGRGTTVRSARYDGQGGGYVELDSSGNYGVRTAYRQALVDLAANGSVAAVLAFRDRFDDATSREWTWQVAPDEGLEITLSGDSFVVRKDDVWMTGWLLDPGTAEWQVADGAVRAVRTGTEAEFRVVLASGRGQLPTATVTGTTVTLGERSYDTTRLDEVQPPAAPPVGDEPATLFLEVPLRPFMAGQHQEVTAVYEWWHREVSAPMPISLQVPEGWTVTPTTAEIPRLGQGQRHVQTWKVTPSPDGPLGEVELVAVAGDDAHQVTDTRVVRQVALNFALGMPTQMSSTLRDSSVAVDGNTDGYFGRGSVAHSQQEIQPWWQVDLGEPRDIGTIRLWNRQADQFPERGTNYYVIVSDVPFGSVGLDEALDLPDVWTFHSDDYYRWPTTIPVGRQGRYVRLQMAAPTPTYLQLAEMEVLP